MSGERRNVYVVARGEFGEGSDPVRAFWTLDGAREWTARVLGVVPLAVGVNTWMAEMPDSRVDQVWIHRMKVWDR